MRVTVRRGCYFTQNAHAMLALPPQRPFTLAFADTRLERLFRHDYARKSLLAVRWAMGLGMFVYSVVYSVVDYLNAPHILGETWGIRALMAVLGGVFIAASYARGFRRWMQAATALVLAGAGWGLMVMLALDSRNVGYYNGPILVIVAIYFMFRLRFAYATFAAWSIVAAFLVVAAFFKDVPTAQFVNSLVFYSAGNLIGMFAAFSLEMYARQAFWHAQVIRDQARENARLLEARSRFFAGVSHELRTPLTLISGPLAHLLESPALPESARAELGVMQRSSQRLLQLVGQLLDFARLEAGHLDLHASRQDAVAFLRGVTASFRSLAERNRLTLDFDTDLDALPLTFDRDKLDRIVVNLLSNAAKFTPEGGKIRVGLREEEGFAVVEVRDTGVGIARHELPRLFDRYRRAASTAHVEGTGLGLTLTKEMVKLHGGRVEVESEVGVGTTFSVYLPTTGVEDARATPETVHDVPLALPAPVDSAPGNAPLVLVVDDDADLRLFVSSVLAGEVRVEEARDGTEALEKARDLVPDLIISDVMMPRLDGFELVAALREEKALDHIPVILLTALTGEADRLGGLRMGADEYLDKPFSPEEVRLRVRNLLARLAQHRARVQATLTAPPGPAPAVEASLVEVESAEDAFLRRARETVEARMEDEHYGVDALADDLGLSRRQLERKLSALVGMTPATYLKTLRLSRAAQLLRGRYGTVSEVAFAVGFANASHFARVFREAYGAAPSEWPDFESGNAEVGTRNS